MDFQKTIFYLREYLFPAGCGGCGTALLTAEDAYNGLCEACRIFLKSFFAGERHCVICGKPLITEQETCLSCREKTEGGEGRYNEWLVKVQRFFPYTGKFKEILASYKFGKSLGVGNFLSCFLDLSLDAFGANMLDGAAWVPVPPRPGKIKKQGWDQIEFLAGLLKSKQGFSHQALPVRRCLKRLPSRSQKELNLEERKTNLKGRILCTGQPPKTAVLFDDVFTTGATLNACAEALLKGGTERVYGVCLFYD